MTRLVKILSIITIFSITLVFSFASVEMIKATAVSPSMMIVVRFTSCESEADMENIRVDVLAKPRESNVKLREDASPLTYPYDVIQGPYYSFSAYEFGGNDDHFVNVHDCVVMFTLDNVLDEEIYIVIYDTDGTVYYNDYQETYILEDDYYEYYNSYTFDGFNLNSTYTPPSPYRDLRILITTILLFLFGSAALLALNYLLQKWWLKKFYPTLIDSKYKIAGIAMVLVYSAILLVNVYWFTFIVLLAMYVIAYFVSVIVYYMMFEKDGIDKDINKLLLLQLYPLMLNLLIVLLVVVVT